MIVVTAPSLKVIPGFIARLASRGKLLVSGLSVRLLLERGPIPACSPSSAIFVTLKNPAVGEVPINTVSLIDKGQSVHGWPSGHALDSEEAIEFAIRNGVKCMVETFKLEKANEAMESMVDGKVRFRGVLVF